LAASAATSAFTNAVAAARAHAAPAAMAGEATAQPTGPLLDVEALQQYYGGSHILRNVGFSAAVGEITVVLGRNGVGKTTLLKSLMGVVPVRSGSVRFGGVDITADTPYRRARRGIGYVPQGREIFARLTVAENLQMGLATRRAGSALPAQLFELFPVLKAMLHRRGGDLSGGQQQQLAIARALAAQPALLVLDEPTEGIQPSIIKDIGRALVHLRRKGEMAILVVEQYFEWARDIADDYAVMDRGKVVLSGTRETMNEEQVRDRMTV